MRWETHRLENVLDMYQPKTLAKKHFKNGPFKVYGANGIIGAHDEFNHEEREVVLGCRGSCGEVHLTEPHSWINGNAMVMRPKDSSQLSQEFLFKALEGGVDTTKAITGSAQPQITRKSLNPLCIPIPPLEEQKRIVEVLDVAFAAIDKAKANIERNLTNARELVQSKIENDLTLSAGSESVHSLSRLLDFGWIVSHQDGNHGSSYPRKAEFVGSGVQYISASCIENGQVNFEKAKHLTEERAKGLTKGVAQSGDVLFAHNATVGPVALLETKKEKVILGTSLTYYRCNPEFLFAPYLLHFMRSRAFVRQYESVMRQSTRNQVPITKQRLFHFHIPSIETQKVLAKNWDVMHSELREYSAKLKSKFEVLEELRQSILEQAFEGKLTEPVAA